MEAEGSLCGGNVSLDASAPLGHLSVVIGQPEVDPCSLADRTKDTVLSGRFTKPFVDDQDVEIFRKALDDTEDLRETRPTFEESASRTRTAVDRLEL